MPGRVDRSSTPRTPVRERTTTNTPRTTDRGGTAVSDNFDGGRARADGAVHFGERNGGPGPVALTASGELTLNGRTGSGAINEVARLIETGLSPFAKATAPQRTKLLSTLTSALVAPSGGKPSAQALQDRSSAATLLLSLARTSKAEVRDAAVGAYVKALSKESSPGLRTSMLVNLDATRLPIPKSARASVDRVRAQVLPSRPPYEEWFKGAKPELNVRHYVMGEFWRTEISGYKKRGFTIAEESDGRVVFEKTLVDPKGEARDVKARVVMLKEDHDVLRDMADPDVQFVIYSGHSQYGGILDASLARAPKTMSDTKLVQLFNCRGKQNVGDLLTRYPGVHATGTYSSAYGGDDVQVLTQTFEMIARRGDYQDIYKGLRRSDLIQPESNYILPDDPRMLATRDSDHDGIRDVTGIGPDWLFDPGRARARGGHTDFVARPNRLDPQTLSGAKLDHAIAYANTTYFYFAEDNRAAPITVKQADRFVSNGWFKGDASEPVRITKSQRDGQTFYKVSINTAYADQSRAAISAMVLMELQRTLCLEDKGKYTADDKLRGLLLVGGYTDLMCDYIEQCEEVLSGTAAKYGFEGVSYEAVNKASLKDGHDGVATRAALDDLKRRGIRALPD